MLIVKSKFVRGIDGTGTAHLISRPRESWSAEPLRALLARYDTDAHCSQYELTGEGAKPRRVRKASLPKLRGQGFDVAMGVLLIDVDGPDHGRIDPAALAEWRAGQLRAIESLPFPVARYDTRGGYRLVWSYPVAVTPDDHETLYYPALVALLAAHGIEADPACKDWTRLFRVPFVRRDGEDEDHPHTLDGGIPVLPVAKLDLARFELEREERKKRAGYHKRSPGQNLSGGTAGDVQGVTGLAELFSARKMIRAHHANRIDVVCPWESSHSGAGSASATSLLKSSGGGWGFVCLHAHSGLPLDDQGPKHSGDVRRLWGAEWAQYCDEPDPGFVGVERPARLPLATIRARLPGIIEEGIRAGRAMVVSPTGSGKTQAAGAVAVPMAERGDVVLFGARTRDVRDELVERLRRIPRLRGDIYTVNGREPSNCEAYDQIEPLFGPGGPKAVKAFCDDCPFRGGCEFYAQFSRARFRPDAGRIVVTTHDMVFKSGDVLDSNIDWLVIDEDPTGTIAGELVVTAEHIDTAIAEGAVSMSDETRGALGRIMGGQSASSTVLATIEGDITLTDADALAKGAAEASRAALTGRPHWQAAEGLALAHAGGWVGCSVHGGALLLPAPRLQWPEAKSRMVLDASGNRAIAEHILPGAVFLDAGAPAEVDHVTVVRYPVAAGRGDIIRRPEFASSVHSKYDSPSTLHVTHKALVDDPVQLGRWDWITNALGKVDYFGSPRQCATNQYAGLSCIVIDSWHLPKAVIRNLAERLKATHPDKPDRELYELARGQLEWAAIDQWLGRLRSVNRPDQEIRVVLIDRRPHWSNVLPDTETIGLIGARVYEHTGALINRPGGVEAYLGKRLAREGALWIDEDVKLPRLEGGDGRPALRQASPLHCLRSQYGGRFGELAPALSAMVGRGVEVDSVQYIRGRRSWRRWYAYVEGSCVYGELIERTALLERVDWIVYSDGRYAGPANIYHTGAEIAENHLAGATLTPAAVATWTGRSVRQVYRILRQLGAGAADLAERGSALFACVTPPDAVRGYGEDGARVAPQTYQYVEVGGFEERVLARGPPLEA